MDWDALFVDVDDFCMVFERWLNQQQLGKIKTKSGRKPQLSMSEIMTILIAFHKSHYRNFKHYYIDHVQKYLQAEFPQLVSYNRFIELTPTALPRLCAYLRSRLGEVTSISFVDATAIPVCHNRRIERHKVFDGLAKRGKTSMGWFFGFKLHLVVNEQGELISFQLTPGNTDDRKPIPELTKRLFGKLFADKGYISKDLFQDLFERGLQLITPIRKDMHNRLMPMMDKILLRKRSIIETINDQLKNISQIAHTRHRSINNFLVNLISGLIAYTHQPKKPSLNLSPDALLALPSVL